MRLEKILMNGNEKINGCLIINLVGNLKIRRTYNLNEELKSNQIKINTNQNPFYLEYILKEKINLFKSIQVGSVIPFYRKSDLLKFDIDIILPSLKRQNELIKIFKTIEEKIELKYKKLDLEKQMLRGIIQRSSKFVENIEEINLGLKLFKERG